MLYKLLDIAVYGHIYFDYIEFKGSISELVISNKQQQHVRAYDHLIKRPGLRHLPKEPGILVDMNGCTVYCLTEICYSSCGSRNPRVYSVHCNRPRTCTQIHFFQLIDSRDPPAHGAYTWCS